jgi:hypothetical protein
MQSSPVPFAFEPYGAMPSEYRIEERFVLLVVESEAGDRRVVTARWNHDAAGWIAEVPRRRLTPSSQDVYLALLDEAAVHAWAPFRYAVVQGDE